MLFSRSSVFAVLAYSVYGTVIPRSAQALPPVFLLAGDSTTHEPGGWGNGFLDYALNSPAFGFNYGVSGASLTPYLQQSTFKTILSQIAKYKSTNTVFVTCQFGHNDQKTDANEAALEGSLRSFVSQVTAAGGVPILVTPLTRRTFSGGSVVQNLAVEAAKALKVAADTNSRFIDLNKASTAYVNAIGNTAAQEYNMSPSDHTHLNPHGEVVFGRLVSDLLVAKYQDIAAVTKPDATMSAALANGKPA